jgi:methionyl-tRNA formyltransferase
MKKMSQTIVFFGSGPVAAASLDLLAQDFEVEAVITKPKPDHHRGDFPVIELAQRLGLKCYTPANKHELSELFTTKPVTSKLGVVIDYGLIINQDVIDYFPLGIVNSHFSLLPEWRGADPITFSVLSGQKETGVSLMIINDKMDEGKLLAQKTLAIDAEMTTPMLTNALIKLSNDLLSDTLPAYMADRIKPYEQQGEPTYSRKLTKQDGIIDWSKPAEVIEREIRGFIEWPKSQTTLAGKDITITAAHVSNEILEPGQVEVRGKEILVGTSEGSLILDRLKPAGKNEMTSEAFLAGHRHLFN